MSESHFTKLCIKAKLVIPATDKDVCKFLEEAGATLLPQKTQAAIQLRKEHAAAILWARENIDKDRSWDKIPTAARDTLLALFPIKQSVIDKGGKAWTAPCRALIRAYSLISEPASKRKKTGQISKGAASSESDGDGTSGSSAEEAAPPPPKKSQKGKEKAGAGSKSKDSGLPPPYLASHALLAILPIHRRAQVYLAESWSTKVRADREKQLERILTTAEFGGRFEDQSAPAWSQRISFRRGPGSAFIDDEIRQDGKNLASVMRWESSQLLLSRHDYDGIYRMTQRAERVRLAWDRFQDGGRSKTAPSTAVLASITRAIQEVLDSRLTSATGELCDTGPAGEEILGDMTRQKREVADLFTSYEQYTASLFANLSVPYEVATRRANSVWFGLLQHAVAALTQDLGKASLDGLEASADAAFSGGGAPSTPIKRARVTSEVNPEPAPAPVSPAPFSSPGGPPPAYPPPGMPAWAWPGNNPYSVLPGTFFGPAPGGAPPAPQPTPPPASPAPVSGASQGQPATPPTAPKKGNLPVYLPVSAGIVGSSRGTVTAPRRQCSRGTCPIKEPHFQWECPMRMLAVYGTAPPGFLPSGAKEPGAWHGNDITPATAAAWKSYLGAHPDIVQAAHTAWVTNFD